MRLPYFQALPGASMNSELQVARAIIGGAKGLLQLHAKSGLLFPSNVMKRAQTLQSNLTSAQVRSSTH